MKLEEQVVSLDLAKRLKELGVKQESYLYWCDLKLHYSDPYRIYTEEQTEKYLGEAADGRKQVVLASAFTVAELGEMLPADNNVVTWRNTLNKWYSQYHQENELEADTEADARAKMLVYLLENRLISHS